MAPRQKPGKSKQDYRTPKEFIQAIEKRFGKIIFDLAAHKDNTQSPWYYSKDPGEAPNPDDEKYEEKYKEYLILKESLPLAYDINALDQNWSQLHQHFGQGLLWLNPEFAHIGPWAEKCWQESQLGANIGFLVPASVGSNWFRNYVFDKGDVYFLNGRLAFVEGDPGYPKDCMFVHFNKNNQNGLYIWDWKENKVI